MSDRPVPTQDQADEFKLEAQGHDPEDEAGRAPEVVDAPAVTVGGNVVASCAVGDTLSVTDGNWTGEPTGYTRSWLSGTAQVGGGTTYVAQASDAGNSISCTVTATNAAGSTNATTNAVSVAAAGG